MGRFSREDGRVRTYLLNRRPILWDLEVLCAWFAGVLDARRRDGVGVGKELREGEARRRKAGLKEDGMMMLGKGRPALDFLC